MKKTYFISDAHLGSLAMPAPKEQEKHLCRFLDEIKPQAESIFILGDLFDFWFEYKNVVPKGYTRLLGKLSELTDMGIAVHLFTGNHDIWCKDYLARECGITIHYRPEVLEIEGKKIFLAHGDGLGDRDRKFLILRSIFHNRFCQWLFRWLHPDMGMSFGLHWAKHSRLKHQSSPENPQGGDPPYLGEDKEPLVGFAKEFIRQHPSIDFFIFGHRHIELDLMLTHQKRLLILGDWITQFTYAEFSNGQISLKNY
jgi:UDP-2,3-diacylglucosamine hydrolase